MMKLIKPYFLLASLLGLTAACTETEILSPEKTPEIVTRPDQREVLLTFENKLVMPTAQQKQASTRSTVPGSPAENKLDAFDIYVFGSATEGGAYTFQQKLSADDMELNETVAGSNAYTAVLRPTKGLFVKLYCVGNSAKLYSIDALPDGGTFTEYTAFTELEQKNGAVTTPGVPTEAAFLALTTASLGTTGVLASALPMTGAVTAPLDLTDFSATSRLSVGLKLTRAVARFDVVNNGTLSKFTIYSIGLSQGRPAATLFPLGGVGAVQEYAPRVFSDGAVATVPSFTDLNGGVANAGNSAFYIYPTVTDGATGTTDPAALVLTGTYQMNLATTVNVTYRIPFDQVRDGNGLQVHINPNHRYVVKITDADPTELKFTISVADWASDDNLNEFDPDNTLIAVKEVTGDGIFVNGVNTFLIDPTAGKILNSQIESNSRIVKSEVIYADEGTPNWLTVKLLPSVTRAGGVFAPLEIKVNDLPDLSDVAKATLKLTNEIGMVKKYSITYPGIKTAEEMYIFNDLVSAHLYASPEVQLELEKDLRKYGTLGRRMWSSVLLADIDLNAECAFDLGTGEITGTPVKWGSNQMNIENFDGKGHTIKNLYALETLFKSVQGTVKNLNVTGIMKHPGASVGGICQIVVRNAKIINCTAHVFIDFAKSAGGICCNADENSEVRNCVSRGVVKASIFVGGICAYSDGGATIACKNEAKVVLAETTTEGGGIVYCAYGMYPSSIIACYNAGTIEDPDGKAFGITNGRGNTTISQCYTTDGKVPYSTTFQSPDTGIATVTNCFFKAGTPACDGFTDFGAGDAWPGLGTHTAWKTSTDGADGAYWKSLGSWNNGVPVYPKLYWEK